MNLVIVGLGNGLTTFDAKSLPEPMLNYCQLHLREQNLMEFEPRCKLVI